MSIYSVNYNKIRNIVYIAVCLLGAGIAQASEGNADVNADSSAATEEAEKKSRFQRMRNKFNQGKEDAKDTVKNSRVGQKAGELGTQAKVALGSAKKDAEEAATQAKKDIEVAAAQAKKDAIVAAAQAKKDALAAASEMRTAAKNAPGRVKQGMETGIKSVSDKTKEMLKKLTNKVCTTSINSQKAVSVQLSKRAEQLTAAAQALRDQATELEKAVTRLEADCKEEIKEEGEE